MIRVLLDIALKSLLRQYIRREYRTLFEITNITIRISVLQDLLTDITYTYSEICNKQ